MQDWSAARQSSWLSVHMRALETTSHQFSPAATAAGNHCTTHLQQSGVSELEICRAVQSAKLLNTVNLQGSTSSTSTILMSMGIALTGCRYGSASHARHAEHAFGVVSQSCYGC